MLYNVPLYFSAVRQTSASNAGLHLLPNSVAISLGSLAAGWVIRKTGRYWWLITTSAALAAFSSLLVAMWCDGTGSIELWFDIVPSGFGIASVITATLIAMIASVEKNDMAVGIGITYLFRTVAQVLGVGLSGSIVQGVLAQELHARIKGPGSQELIDRIRHSTEVIKELEPTSQIAAIESYKSALKVVFICQTVVAVLAVVAALPTQEYTLPDTLSAKPTEPESERVEDIP